jgi:hypothetical protein
MVPTIRSDLVLALPDSLSTSENDPQPLQTSTTRHKFAYYSLAREQDACTAKNGI